MTTPSGPNGASRPAEKDTPVAGPSSDRPSAPTTAIPKVTPIPIPKPGSIPSLPPSAEAAAAAARAQAASGGSPAQGTPTPHFGVLRPGGTGNHYTDGRVRNPMPSKLRGKTDGSKGNFGVMLMDVGMSESAERDARAKRTSQSTEAAARRAFENGYVSLKRSRFVQVPDETAEPPAVPQPYVPAAPTPAPAPRTSPGDMPAAPQVLTSEDVKSEQARLLTLLRSLHPVLVVDHICKALAFFGGIPGAPPPANDAFPQSADANGSGRLLVGWLAEIFPKLGHSSQNRALSPMRQLDVLRGDILRDLDHPQPPRTSVSEPQALAPPVTTEPEKRRRGRPKGSKAAKPRKDKGIKKGPMRPTTTSQPPPDATNALENSWIDVDDDGDGDGEEEEAEGADEVDRNIMLLAQATSPELQPLAMPQRQPPAITGSIAPASGTPLRTSLPGAAPASVEVGADGTPKKRGRPKGSKNRPKELSTPTPQTSQVSQAVQATPGPGPEPQAATASSTPLFANQAFTPVNTQGSTTTPASEKRKIGRPKGSKTKQKLTNETAQDTLGGTAAHPAPHALTQGQSLGLAHATHTAQTVGQAQGYPAASGGQVVQQASAPSSGLKRKRNNSKNANNLQPAASSTPILSIPAAHANGSSLPTPASNRSSHPDGQSNSAVAPASAKRQRKTKETRTSTTNHAEPMATASNGANYTGPVPAVVTSSPPQPVPVSASAPNSTSAPSAPALLQAHSLEAVDPPTLSLHSPGQSQFEVQSPTMMENYEAQLQAQMEQAAEAEAHKSTPAVTTNQSRPDSRRFVPNRQQQQQQNQYHQRQLSQSSQQPQPASQSRSPNPQQHATKSQTPSPMISQQGARSSQPAYSHYRAPSTQYNQQSSYGIHQTQQQTQSRQQQQQYSTQQQSSRIVTSAAQSQQHPATAQQPQQYSSVPQTQSHSSGQQKVPQQRFQQNTSGASGNSYTAHQSPQFPASSNSFNSTDHPYRNSTSGLSSTMSNSYSAQRSQTTTPTAANVYHSTNSAHSLPQYSPTNTSQHQQSHQRSTSSSGHHNASDGQGMTSMQSFGTTAAAAEWGIFDTSTLDTSSNHPALGLNSSGYNIGSGGVSRAATGANNAFAGTGLANFETSGGSYYGVRR